jgi:hypothetical protein
MSFLKRIFSSNPANNQANNPASQPAPHSVPASAFNTKGPGSQENSSRRELLRLVLRDTLNRTGIPTSWIGADLLAATSRGREPGIHVRLLLKHWDPRLMLHGIAFENAYKKRVLTLDPLAERWLLGISWQYSLVDEAACPPMPHPGIWTSAFGEEDTDVAALAEQSALRNPDPVDLLGGSIVISGPAATPDPSAARPAAAAAIRQASRHAAPEQFSDSRTEAKADLERLFAIRDADVQRHSTSNSSAQQFAATEPAGLMVVPATPRNGHDAAAVQASFAKTDVFRRPGATTPPEAASR